MNNETKRLVTMGILSALGAVLMILEIPWFIPFLKIDLSDVVVLVVFFMFGWKEALVVGFLKAFLHGAVYGPVGPAYIGQITAFIASMSYVLGFHLTTNKLNLNRVVSAVVTVAIVTTILTIGNYFFITPIWFGGLTWLDVKDWVTPESFGLNVSGGYLLTILITYLPFNFAKGIVITSVFFLVDRSIKVINKTA